VIIYLIKGELPWQGLKGANKHEKQAQILDSKMNTPESILCAGMPSKYLISLTFLDEFVDAFLYVKNLEFD
jgi:hypothetical protein